LGLRAAGRLGGLGLRLPRTGRLSDADDAAFPDPARRRRRTRRSDVALDGV